METNQITFTDDNDITTVFDAVDPVTLRMVPAGTKVLREGPRRQWDVNELIRVNRKTVTVRWPEDGSILAGVLNRVPIDEIKGAQA